MRSVPRPLARHARELRYLLVGAGAALAVWATVGVVAAVVVATLVLAHARWPGRRILAVGALLAVSLIPVLWFAGSSLPLSPPSTRIQDNGVAHQVGGAAVWLMFLAVLADHLGKEGPTRDRQTPDRQTPDSRTSEGDGDG